MSARSRWSAPGSGRANPRVSDCWIRLRRGRRRYLRTLRRGQARGLQQHRHQRDEPGGLAIFGPLFSVLASEIPKGFDPPARVRGAEAGRGGRCARLVPEPVTVRVKPRQTVELTSGLVDFDSAPLPGTVMSMTAAKATVTAQAEADPTARFTYTALSAVPPGRTRHGHAQARLQARAHLRKTVTVIYDDPPPPPLPNAYSRHDLRHLGQRVDRVGALDVHGQRQTSPMPATSPRRRPADRPGPLPPVRP